MLGTTKKGVYTNDNFEFLRIDLNVTNKRFRILFDGTSRQICLGFFFILYIELTLLLFLCFVWVDRPTREFFPHLET